MPMPQGYLFAHPNADLPRPQELRALLKGLVSHAPAVSLRSAEETFRG